MSDRNPVADDEEERLRALHAFGILDTPPEAAFDDLTRIVRHVCGTSIAVVTLVDAGRQWFKSEIGLGLRETGLDLSICVHAVRQQDMLIVPDLAADPRFRDHPAVTGSLGLRFYAGAPLRTADGHVVGTMCVADCLPRDLDEMQVETLRALARQSMALLELRKANARQAQALAEKQRATEAKSALVDELQHRFKNNLQTIDSLLSLHISKDPTPGGRQAIERLRDRLRPLYLIQDRVLAQGNAVVDLHVYLHAVAHGAVTLHRGRGLQADWEEALDRLSVSRIKALPLGLIVNEFFANSFNHAFAGGRGRLVIRLTGLAGERARLELADDGPGFVVTPHPPGPGLGVQLIGALAVQAGGKPMWDMNGGARLILEFSLT